MNKALNDIKKITDYAADAGIRIKQILVPRTVLNDVRLGMISLGLDPKDFYDPEVPGRNLRLEHALLVEDLTIDEIHAEVERA